jgi:hypothetical protein
MVKVVSMALFTVREPDAEIRARYAQNEKNFLPGSVPERFFYNSYLPAIVRAHASCYPGWELWIYHDSSLYASHYGDVLMRLHRAGRIRLIYVGEPTAVCEGMLWRMKPIFEAGVEFVATRDIDAIPQPRDFKCIEEFSQSAGTVQVIHDSISHCGIMGGMSCFSAARAREHLKCATWDQMMERARTYHLERHGADQQFLAHAFDGQACVVRFPPRVDQRDLIAPHIGGAGPAEPVIRWYDSMDDDATRRVREAENIQVHPDETRHVIMSCDDNPLYIDLMPLTCLLWSRVVGYTPTVILVGDPAKWMEDQRLRYVCDTARAWGARLHWLTPLPQFRTATVSQVSRLFAAALPGWHGNPYLLTSDVDMWPLSGAWFRRADFSKPLHHFYANSSGYKQFAICYVGAPRTYWQQLMGMTAAPIALHVEHAISAAGACKDGSQHWNLDEQLLTAAIMRRDWRNEMWCNERSGCPPNDRIDRYRWPDAIDLTGKVDAHVVRPLHAHVKKLAAVLDRILCDGCSDVYMETIEGTPR